MIKATVGELKTENVKPFPKLMKFTYPSGHSVILLVPNHLVAIVINVQPAKEKEIMPDKIGDIWYETAMNTVRQELQDYNGTITLQNE